MQRLRTNGTLLMFIFGAHLIFTAPSVVTSYKIDDNAINLEKVFHNERNIVQLSDITERANDDDKKSLITYRPINQPKANSEEEAKVAEDWRLYEITIDGFSEIGGGEDDSILLISTQHKESCQKNSSTQFPAWKIDKSVSKEGKFRLKINHAKELAGKTLYLCFFNESSKQFEHFGNEKHFFIDSGVKAHEILKREAAVQDEEGKLEIVGFRIERTEKDPEIDENGIPVVRADTMVLLRLFGFGFNESTRIGLTQEKSEAGTQCKMMLEIGYFTVSLESSTNALVNVKMPKHSVDLYLCAATHDNFIHQGHASWLQMKSHEPLLPTWVQVLIIMTCLCFSALFSGLNLGLMSLDRTDLKILCNTGSDSEKRYANAIQPVRDHGNFLLCSILLGNVLVNSTFTILLDSLTSGLVAIVCSTLLIVIFGEITPQAICSRHGLAVGARTIFVTKFIMLLTFPLSYPTSKILDYLLGEEIGTYYNRERLNELVKVTKDHNDLDKDEVNIISGVLEMRKKAVGDIMTPIEDAYMLSIDSILDFETVSKIMNSGYSRIPVYEGDRENILSLLYIKDLAFVDTDDNTPLRMLCEFYQNPCHFVFDDLTLDVMFKQFKEGNKGHMAFVHRVNNDGDGDPFYETIGLVTLEDVIEELIQAEIMDETDRITDNRTKNRRSRPDQKQDFSFFVERRPDTQKVRVSPQLTLAAFQFMSTTLEPFRRDCINENILRRLLNQDVVRHIKNKSKGKNDLSLFIFHQGKPVDFFVLILEGRVEVTVGKESLVFEGGPFTHFGLQALQQNVGFDSPLQQVAQSQVLGSLQSLNMDAMLRHSFIPDYSVKALTDVVYIVVKRSLYLAAKRATLMEQSKKMGEHSNEPFDDEVEKLLHSLDEDDSVAHTNVNSPRMSKPASPSSQQFLSRGPSRNKLHSESDLGARVTFNQTNGSSNHIASFTNSQKASVDIHDGHEGEVEQPLLNSSTNS